MTAVARAVVPWVREAWDYVRAVMGDRAYETYLETATRQGAIPLSAEDFYLDSVKRRYSTISRCC